ncbi:TspO/MBR family protein [Bordetella petrii]|uniref:TspO/MBR family protein n=1 Tax=Bordetella petrii TaxID=94624 RepID=UPI001E5F560F|nr:TspO/MBR family protein [Bordetella petrii]MCD0503352.1 tryptophan-rich sensory protein [Bordetella petrii]
MNKYRSLVFFLAVTAAVALWSGQFRPGDWYAALEKPAFNPPDWVFAPAWTALYTMMAVAAWRVWRRVGLDVSIVLWGVQLALNGAWSWLFFGLHRTGLALADIMVLLAAILLTAVCFMRRDRAAGYLMLPYLAWVGFATALNYSLWKLNG